MVIELEFRKKIFRSEKDTSHSLQMKFLKFRQYLQKTSYIHHQRSQKRRNSGKVLLKRAEKMFRLKSFFKLNFYRSVVMDSFPIELVSNASFNCYPNNTLSSFTNFLL